MEKLDEGFAPVSQSWDVTIRKNDFDASGSLGVELAVFFAKVVVVCAVKPGGFIDSYNRANPNTAIQAGDVLARCNGVEDDANAMLLMFKQSQALRFRVRRVSSFHATLCVSESTGLKLNTSTMAVTDIVDGPAMRYNKKSAAGYQIMKDDRIIAVDGSSGTALQLWQAMHNTFTPRTMTLTIQRPGLLAPVAHTWDVNISRSRFETSTTLVDPQQSTTLGVDFALLFQKVVVVCAIKAGGLIDVYNKANPSTAIEAGDVLVSCNGVREDSSQMLLASKQSDYLQFLVRRVRKFQATLCLSDSLGLRLDATTMTVMEILDGPTMEYNKRSAAGFQIMKDDRIVEVDGKSGTPLLLWQEIHHTFAPRTVILTIQRP
jgi:hypothetical protein